MLPSPTAAAARLTELARTPAGMSSPASSADTTSVWDLRPAEIVTVPPHADVTRTTATTISIGTGSIID